MASNFADTVGGYCSQIGWDTAGLDNEHAKISFSMESGTQTLYIMNYDPIVEFSVPSVAVFDSDDEMPHILSSILLYKNSNYKMGAWSIEKIGEKCCYSLMHNCELRVLDRDYFREIAVMLITECDEFDGFIAQLGSGAETSSSPAIRPSAPRETSISVPQRSSFDWGRVAQIGLETLVRTFVQDEVNSFFDRGRR
jgi:hypothetical protein